jgi:hypothetical protein
MVYYIEMWDVRYPKGADFWQRLQSMFEWASDDFLSSSVQTYEEALGMDDHARNEGTGHAEIIPYRRTGDHDNLLYFHQMGVDLIPQLAPLLAKKTLSNELFLKWSELMFCHGWISSVRFSEGDDLGYERAGLGGAMAKSREPQRRWMAHLLAAELDRGKPRKLADGDVAARLQRARTSGTLPEEIDEDWLNKILHKNGRLHATYTQKHFSERDIRRLVGEPMDGLPPVDF